LNKIKYAILTFGIIDFLLIVAFISVKLKFVEHYVRVYSLPQWKISSNNGIRIAFLKYLTNESFLNYNLNLKLIDEQNKEIELENKKIANTLYNKTIFIDEKFKEGNYKLKGELTIDGKIIEQFNESVELVKNAENKPYLFYEKDNLDKDGKVSVFEEARNSDFKFPKDVQIQLFGSLKEIIPFEKNILYFLMTYPDYSFVKEDVLNINLSKLNQSTGNVDLQFGKNGLASIEITPNRVEGDITFLNTEITKTVKAFGKFTKTIIEPNKFIFDKEEELLLMIKAFKDIDGVYLSIFNGNIWLVNDYIQLTKKLANYTYKIPANVNGFLDIVIYKDYFFPALMYKTKVFVGSKDELKNELLKINHQYLNSVFGKNAEDDLFYNFIVTQLDVDFDKIPLLHDSFEIQKKNIDTKKVKYSNFIWWSVFCVSLLITLLVALWGHIAIKVSNSTIEYQFKKNQAGNYGYILIAVFLLIFFFTLILFILKIV